MSANQVVRLEELIYFIYIISQFNNLYIYIFYFK